MIANAKAISYGCNDLSYITGESINKKHPEKIFRIFDKYIPGHLDATSIWESMKVSAAQYPRKIDNSVIRFEISPAKENTTNFTRDDWQKLWEEFVEEFDKQERYKNGKLYSGKTHLADSKQTVWLHLESNSGIPHLHAAVCRVYELGRINNDHDIHLRARQAAEQVAIKRGWKLASVIHEERRPEISDDCYYVLKSMHHFNLMEYFRWLEKMGYLVKANTPDKKGIIHGYSLNKNGCRYKASELGTGRNLTVTNLPKTWAKLHDQMEQKQHSNQHKPEISPRLVVHPQTIHVQHPVLEPKFIPASSYRDYTHWFNGSSRYSFYDNERHKNVSCFIPSEVNDFFEKEFDYTEILNWRELSDMAVQLFIGYLDAATSMQPSGGGGGGINQEGWGRKKDEDDLEFARRCAHSARHAKGVTARRSMKR